MLYRPATQSVQAEAPWPDHLPIGHEVQTVLLTALVAAE